VRRSPHPGRPFMVDLIYRYAEDEKLPTSGFAAQYKVRGGIIVEPQEIGNEGARVYAKPMPEGGVPLVRTAEAGGGGFAVVVCGLSGRKLKPFWVNYEPAPYGATARFTTPGGIVTVSAEASYADDVIITVKAYTILEKSDSVVLAERVLYRSDQLPGGHFRRWYPAAVAAKTKLKCPNCRHVHYAETVEKEAA